MKRKSGGSCHPVRVAWLELSGRFPADVRERIVTISCKHPVVFGSIDGDNDNSSYHEVFAAR